MQSLFNGSYFDEDYFENGRITGKSWYENYHYMPERSIKEAKAYISFLNLSKDDYILDYGTGKGFLVRAFRDLGYRSDGCDISKYALSYAPENCWNCSNDSEWDNHKLYDYTYIIAKDVFEHLSKDNLQLVLTKLQNLSNRMVCIVPMGDNGKYRIPEYHLDKSHIIIENEQTWSNYFIYNGWNIVKDTNHIPGIKDNWIQYTDGNRVFVLEVK